MTGSRSKRSCRIGVATTARRLAIVVASLGGAAACGGKAENAALDPSAGSSGVEPCGAGGTGAGGTGAGRTPSEPGIWASIEIDLTPPLGTPETAIAPARTSITMSALASPPVSEPYSIAMEVGLCRLVVRTDAICTVPFRANLGTLVFDGIALQSGSTNWSVESNDLPSTAAAFPPCSAGESVRVSGGAVPATAFLVEGACIEPLALGKTNPLPFEPDKAFELVWTPPSVEGNSRILVRIDSIRYFNNSAALIRCDAPDTGSLTVDAALVNALLALGTTGFPRVYVTRRSSATAAAGSGQVSLNIEMTLRLELTIPGVTSCDLTGDCPAGFSCGTGTSAHLCVAAI